MAITSHPEVEQRIQEKIFEDAPERAPFDKNESEYRIQQSINTLEDAISRAISEGKTKEDLLAIAGDDDDRATAEMLRRDISAIYDELTSTGKGKEKQPEVLVGEKSSSFISVDDLEPIDGLNTYTLGDDSQAISEYLLDGNVGFSVQDNKLEAEELTLGQAISESSSFEELFDTFQQLGQGLPSGYSPSFDYARELNKETHVAVFSEVQPSELINDVTVSELNDDIMIEEGKSDLQVHLEEAALNLNELDVTQDSKHILSQLAVEFTPLFYNRAISELIEAKQAEAWQSTGIMEKLGEGSIMLLDAFGLQERTQQVNTLSKLTGEELEFRFYRSDVLADGIEKSWDGMSFQQQFEILKTQLETLDAVEKGLGVRSSLVGTMVLGDLNTALTQGSLGSDDWVSWVEAASAVPVLGWLIKSPQRLKAFAKASAVKNNAYYNYLNGLTSEQQLEREMEAVKNFQKMFNPNNQSDNVEILIKENRVDVEVELPLKDLGEAASAGVSRGEHKNMGRTKKDLGAKREALRKRDVNKEARDLAKSTKTKFKDAKKRIKADIDEAIKDVDAQLETLQVKINNADEAFKAKQKLSREKTKGTPSVIETPVTRTVVRARTGKLMDVTAKYSPSILKSVMHSTDDIPTLEASAQSLGYTLDDVVTASMNKVPNDSAEGVNPELVVPDTQITPNDVMPEQMLVSPQLLAQRNLKDVLSAEEQKATVDSTFQNVMSLLSLNGHLRVDHSLTTQVDENTIRSIARIGKNESQGYDSYDIAKLASKNIPEGNIRIVVKHPSSSKFSEVSGDLNAQGLEYYVEVKKDITFDAMDASSFTDTSTKYGSNWVNELFFEPVDKLDRNIVKAVSYLRNIDNSLVKKLDKILAPFTGASKRVRAESSKILVHGDLNEVDHTLESASNVLGRVLTEEDKVWQAYGAVNRYYKELGYIRNWRERARLVKDGFKGTSIVDSEGRQVFARLMKDGEVKASIKDGQTKAWDMAKQEEVDLKELEFTPMAGRTYMKTSTIINRDGKSYNIVVNSLEDLKELPNQVIPLRQGHVDLFYEDVGAVIKLTKPNRINGKLEKAGAAKVLRLANSEEEALKWLDTVEEGSTLTNREVLAKEAGLEDGDDIVVELSREAKLEAGVTNSSWNGNVKPYNLRKRGEAPVSSITGDAQVMSLEDRLVKSHNALSNRFARDGIDIIKQRWLKTYGEYLQDPTRIPDDLTQGLVKDMGAQTRTDAQNVLNYIHNQERQLGFKNQGEFVRALDSTLSIIGKVPVIGRALPKPVLAAMDITRWVAIYGRPLAQFMFNTAGVSLNIIQKDPLRGTASVMQSLGAIHGLALTKAGSKIESNVMAKMYGFDDAEDFNNFLEGVRNGGIFSTAQLDNILTGTKSTKLHMAKNGFLNFGDNVRNLPKAVVTSSTDVGHLIAYRHAVKIVKDKGLNPYKGTGRVEADSIWQDLTQRMNKSSTLATENNDYSKLIALFTQQVTKGFKDTVLQPAVKVVTNKDISKNPSLWANSYKQALVSTLMNIGLFGFAGMVGKNTLDKLGVTEEVNEVLVEGMLDSAMAYLTGQDQDFASRLSYGDAIGMFFSLTELDTLTLNLIGAGEIAYTKLGKFAQTVKVMYNTPFVEDGDLISYLRFMKEEGLSIFSGWSDVRKARMVKAWGLYFNNTGLPQMQVDPDSWITTAFSFSPDRVQEYSSMLYDGDYDPESDLLRDIPNLFTRYAYTEMLSAESEEGGLTYDKFNEIVQRTLRLADGAMSELGADNLKLKVERKLFQNIIYPKDVALDTIMRQKVEASLSRILEMKTQGEAKEKLEFFINTSDDEMLVEEATRALKVLENQQELFKQ